jgi:hypothetical protein
VQHTLEEETALVARIEADLRPKGLQSLIIGPPTPNGDRLISAKINPTLPLAHLIKAAKQTSAFPAGASRRTVITAVQIETAQSELIKPGPIEPSVPPGRGVTSAGVVFTGPGTVGVVTWNLSLDYGLSRARGAQSDAEMQFVKWYDEQTDAFKQSIQALMVNNQSKSPCADCSVALLKIGKDLSEIHRAPLIAKPRLVWTTLHGGASATTSQMLTQLMVYWDLQAPETAIPESPGVGERSIYADKVKIAPLK